MRTALTIAAWIYIEDKATAILPVAFITILIAFIADIQEII